jgi:hypothetical protein
MIEGYYDLSIFYENLINNMYNKFLPIFNRFI